MIGLAFLALAQAVAPPPIQQFDAMQALRAYQMGQEARQADERAAREQEQYDLAQKQAESPAQPNLREHPQYELAERMAGLMGQGRCEEAYNLAVLAGDQAMADRSRGLCRPPPQ